MRIQYQSSWSESYLQGAVDSQTGNVNNNMISAYVYYLQVSAIMMHPSVDFFEEFLLDDEQVFQTYDAYFKGAIETADPKTLVSLELLFDNAIMSALQDFDEESSRSDEWYQRPEDLPYIFLNHLRNVELKSYNYGIGLPIV